MRRLRAGDGVLRRRDDDLDGVAKARFQQVTGWHAVICTIRNNPGYRFVDLIQEPR